MTASATTAATLARYLSGNVAGDVCPQFANADAFSALIGQVGTEAEATIQGANRSIVRTYLAAVLIRYAIAHNAAAETGGTPPTYGQLLDMIAGKGEKLPGSHPMPGDKSNAANRKTRVKQALERNAERFALSMHGQSEAAIVAAALELARSVNVDQVRNAKAEPQAKPEPQAAEADTPAAPEPQADPVATMCETLATSVNGLLTAALNGDEKAKAALITAAQQIEDALTGAADTRQAA